MGIAPAEYDPKWAQGIQDHTGFVWPQGPPPPGPFDPDPCMVAQISREVENNRKKFDIILSNAANGDQWWQPTYIIQLNQKKNAAGALIYPDSTWGWCSGDKSGYKGAYMFLVNRADGRLGGRVHFAATRDDDAAYAKVNDSGMLEIQTTKLGYDGKCGNPPDQGQDPGTDTEYEPNDEPDERPVIKFMFDGVEIEDRSYTNTVIKTPGSIKFRDGGLVSEPFEANNGYGNAPHTVYQRKTVFADSIKDGNKPAITVYYDTLDPAVIITEG